MDIELMSKNYTVRRLDRNDVEILYDMMCKNKIFYQYHPPFVTRERILEDLETLPPNKEYEDKYYVGFFEGDCLVASMDMILSYPTENAAFIGFFMMDVQWQKCGVGSRIIREVCSYLKRQGFSKIRLGVDKGNPQSFAFWSKNGFSVVGENEYIMMELGL